MKAQTSRPTPDGLTCKPTAGHRPLQRRPSKARLDVALLSVATAAPAHVVTQREVVRGVREVFSGQFEDFARIAATFISAGIEERHVVKPADWYYGVHGWPERTTAYLEGALALFIEAAGKALDRASITADAVDTIVTVSSTGIATPSLEARAMRALGFRSDVRRVPVFGLGCAGGVAGLSIGADLAMARPGSVVLVVAVELCSLAVRRDQPTKANMVALALFGDGAAAAVLTSRTGRRRPRGRDRTPYLAGYARHHGLEGRSGRLRRDLRSVDPSLCARASGRALDAILTRPIVRARRYRPLRVPSRWPQGAGGHRRRSRPRAAEASITSAR